jgi:hypothetical protein
MHFRNLRSKAKLVQETEKVSKQLEVIMKNSFEQKNLASSFFSESRLIKHQNFLKNSPLKMN